MGSQSCNVLIGGEAGQGLQTMGEAFTRALARAGYRVHVTQTYESRVRGGHNVFAIRFSPTEVRAPAETVDLLVALNQETLDLHAKEMSPWGMALAGEAWEIPQGLRAQRVPYSSLSGNGFTNTVAMGVAGAVLGVEEAVMAGALGQVLGKGKAGLLEANLKALEAAYSWVSQKGIGLDVEKPASVQSRRIVLNGHEAVALGAISAGVRFCAFYPMSPSTSVAMTMIQWAKEMGLVVEQAEDEIAAINMAIGASYAGVPSLVPTSGGGFALMVEGVSLAAVSETPVVVLIGQRPGPATGLATRTEQADLEFVLHAGHGEFPKAVFAPGNVEDCFYLTRKAVELAEKYQGPTFILTDHFLADSYRDVTPFPVRELNQVIPGEAPEGIQGRYSRYAITPSGVSPRLLPGKSTHLVVADSHEHTETGHITEDLTLRPKMVEKRLRKAQGLKSEVIPPRYVGPQEPDLLLVGWGSTQGAIEEAAVELSAKGKKVSTLHFCQLWPLAEELIMPHLLAANRVVCVEGNATGQLARLIRRETGFNIQGKISRYDGLPINPQYIMRALEG
ncbi:MAG: 2-oxoacid:acceptor oxidoreductase subunit alpha [Thermodesulfobacteriota bacterium]